MPIMYVDNAPIVGFCQVNVCQVNVWELVRSDVEFYLWIKTLNILLI